MTAPAVHEYPLVILERHLDGFGHVNNATYLEIFEEARWDLITRGGFGLAQVRERMIGPVVLAVEMRFSREATNRQRVVVRTRCLEYRGKVGRLEQTLVREDGLPSCEAVFTFGLFDLRSRRLLRPTPEWLRAVGVPSPA
ncbi:MAG: acyl-CoA thioesterase [Elusimicrobia bacterium]|nr:acyl-CoA thioesterase [Elusimicrobiota bacterium]